MIRFQIGKRRRRDAVGGWSEKNAIARDPQIPMAAAGQGISVQLNRQAIVQEIPDKARRSTD
jgi:hypothetical protein